VTAREWFEGLAGAVASSPIVDGSGDELEWPPGDAQFTHVGNVVVIRRDKSGRIAAAAHHVVASAYIVDDLERPPGAAHERSPS
jgi:hypothetical protein